MENRNLKKSNTEDSEEVISLYNNRRNKENNLYIELVTFSRMPSIRYRSSSTSALPKLLKQTSLIKNTFRHFPSIVITASEPEQNDESTINKGVIYTTLLLLT